MSNIKDKEHASMEYLDDESRNFHCNIPEKMIEAMATLIANSTKTIKNNDDRLITMKFMAVVIKKIYQIGYKDGMTSI